VPTSPKIYARTTLENLRWQIEPSTQYTNMYILMNHWIATNTTANNCLKNRQTCSKLHHLYTTFSKCLPPARIKISAIDQLKRRIMNEWTVWITLFTERAVGDVAPTCTCLCSCYCWRQTFRTYDVKWCDLLHDWRFLKQWLPVVFVLCSYTMIH